MKKFTQEVKDAWLNALKSSHFKQGFSRLVTKGETVRHCCIGVLGEIDPDLNNSSNDTSCPYNFLNRTIGTIKMDMLWNKNDEYSLDSASRPEDYKDDYSNVIPLIEALPVQE
jgi:hypothetical protein